MIVYIYNFLASHLLLSIYGDSTSWLLWIMLLWTNTNEGSSFRQFTSLAASSEVCCLEQMLALIFKFHSIFHNVCANLHHLSLGTRIPSPCSFQNCYRSFFKKIIVIAILTGDSSFGLSFRSLVIAEVEFIPMPLLSIYLPFPDEYILNPLLTLKHVLLSCSWVSYVFQ